MDDGMRYDIENTLATAPNRGQIILLMGTAADGPVKNPIRIRTEAEYNRIFGDPAVGDLGRGFLEILRTNHNLEIHLMRISGAQATASVGDSLLIRSRYGGYRYNDININFTVINDSQEAPRDAMIITVNDEFGIPQYRVNYFLDDYEIVNDLVSMINTDAKAGISPIFCSTKMPYQPIADLWSVNRDTVINLIGGADGLGLNKDDRYLALDECYGLLEGYYLDVVVPLEAFFDDTHPAAFYGKAFYGSNYYATKRDYLTLADTENDGRAVMFHEQLITFCQRQEALGIFTRGVIGMAVIDDPKKITDVPYSYIHDLLSVTAFKDRNGLSDFSNGEWLDKGQYVSIVAGEFIYKEGTTEEYTNNFYVVYAAMIASLFGNVSTTNQPVPMPDITLRYEFSTEEITDMAFLGVVCFRFSVKRGIVVANGVTAALSSSDMHYISNVRMMQITMSLVDAVMQDLVGQNILPLVVNRELHTAIGETLKYLASPQIGILKGYSYSVKWDTQNGKGSVDLKLMPRYAFEYTGTRVNLKTR